MKIKKILVGMLLFYLSSGAVSETLLAGSVVCYGGEEALKTYATAGEKEKEKLEKHTCPPIAGETKVEVLVKKKVVVSGENISIVKIRMENNYLKGAFDEVWTFEEKVRI